MSSVRRADRVARMIQDELSTLVRREVRDPRVDSLTITRVTLSADLRDAVAYFVPMGGVGSEERVAELEAGLKAASAFLQGKVGRNLRLRSTPRLRFRYDKGVQNLVEVHELLRGMKPGEVAVPDSSASEPETTDPSGPEPETEGADDGS